MSRQQVDDALLARSQGSTQNTTGVAVTPYGAFTSPIAGSMAMRDAGSSPSDLHVVIPMHGSIDQSQGERSGRSTGILDFTEQDVDDVLHEERNCCGCCSCAFGRCLSHCWFLSVCFGFIFVSSLPRILTILDFVITAGIYSLSFAGRSQPSLSFWQFLEDDFTHYDFHTSGGSLVILAFLRMASLFFVFAYRFHLKPAAFIAATSIAAVSCTFVLMKFAFNTNSHLYALLVWSLSITCLEYIVWLGLRRQRIGQPVLSAPVLDDDASQRNIDAMDTSLISPVSASGGMRDRDLQNGHPAAASVEHSPRIHPKQVDSYQRLTSDDSGSAGGVPVPFSSPATAIPTSSRSLTSSASSMSHSSSFIGSVPNGSVGSGSVGAGSLRGGLFLPKSSEQEIEPSALADQDSLFVEIDSIIVHYKLSVGARPVLSGRNRTESSDFVVVPQDPERGIVTSAVTHEAHTDGPDATSAHTHGASSLSSSAGTGAPSSLASPSYFDSASAATSSAFQSEYPPSSQLHSPLVLMHGFGASLFTWRSTWLELSRHSPILLSFDRPGFGLTSRPVRDSTGSFGTWVDRSAGGRGVLREQENPYTQEYAVKLLFKLLTTLGLTQRKSVLVAHSTGGAIAVRAAIERPDLIGGCFLISPHLLTAGFPSMLKSLLKTKLGKIITQQLVRSELGEVTLKRAWYDSAHIPPDTLANYQRLLRVKGQMEALIEIAQTAPKPDDPWVKLSDRLRELAGPNATPAGAHDADEEDPSSPAVGGTPVCILHGIQDKLVDVSESVKAYKQMRRDGVNVTLIKLGQTTGHAPRHP